MNLSVRLGLLAMLQVKRVLADMPYNQVSKVNWKRSWEVAVPEPVAKTPDVVPLPAPPPGILVNRAARHYGPCPLCISVSSYRAFMPNGGNGGSRGPLANSIVILFCTCVL